jgi:hypothetical protein
MDVSYEPAAWRELYLMIGGAAAVLTGLIFVAVSLHPTPVLADRYMRGRAESSLLALMVVLLISGAVLIPEQPVWLLGVEVAILAIAPHSSGLRGLRGLRHLRAPRQQRIVVELLVGLAAAALGFLAGVSLVIHWGGGLWLLLPGGAIALASSVWNAWRLMVEVAAAHDR